jgi:predicted dehydrogenase
MDKALVVGLGMGQQYKNWLTELNYNVITVDADSSKGADFLDVASALISHPCFNVVYIGTPNFTHEAIARQVAEHTRLLIIEKPGVATAAAWEKLINDFPKTRIMMVKNNQYRVELSGFKDIASISEEVEVCWSRQDGVPFSPWFTDKDKAFGGVGRDLMPHLLSFYTAITNFDSGVLINSEALDKNNTGIDDSAKLSYNNKGVKWTCYASWKNNIKDEFYIKFIVGYKAIKFDLGDYMTAFGGCPAGPYISMIKKAVNNLDNDQYWQHQLQQDKWIHTQMEKL